MKKINNILYLTDELIYLKYKNKLQVISYKLSKNIIINGKIANINKFMTAYSKMLQENGLNNALFGETIKIIVNPSYTQADISLLKSVFETFNYRKIYVDYETKYYKLNSSNAYLSVYDTYAILTYIDEYKKTISLLLPSNLFLTSESFMEYVYKRIKDKEIYLIGKGEMLSEVFNNFENIYGNKTYLFSDNENFIINNASR